MLKRSHTRIFIVDDSAFFGRFIENEFQKNFPEFEIIGTEREPLKAVERIIALKPDVVTIDFEMPDMNGIELLEKLIPKCPVPVIVVSGKTVNVLEALSAGAVDFIKKPDLSPDSKQVFIRELSKKIEIAKGAKVIVPVQKKVFVPTKPQAAAPTEKIYSKKDESIIAIGSSTGGPDALMKILTKLPENIPPIAIVQHMPEGFTKLLAERIDKSCAFNAAEAEDGMRLKNGFCVVGKAGVQMKILKDREGYYISLEKDAVKPLHSPSVDVLFDSVAKCAGKNAIGVILTGMGADGAKGMLTMKKAGAYTIGQDEKTCVVYGMPMEAYKLGGVDIQLPIDAIAMNIIRKLNS